MPQKVVSMRLPEINTDIYEQYHVATPISKMPNCPCCGDDELGMIQKDEAFCYRCCAIIRRSTHE